MKIKKQDKIILSITGLLLLLITILVMFDKTSFIDNFVYDLIMTFNSSFMTNIMMFITNAGGILFIIALVVVIMLLIKKERLFFPILAIITTITNQSLKYIFQRPRPETTLLVESGFSFPSGHSMISTTLYLYLCQIIIKNTDKKYHNFIYISTIVLISLICISRIYLGVHYFTDVFAGILLSLTILILFKYLKNYIQKKIR